MRYILGIAVLFSAVFCVCIPGVNAFEQTGSNTPDSWSQQVSPGQLKESYTGIGLSSDTNLYLTLTSRYKLKTNDYADDQDFYQYLRVHTDAVKVGNGTVRFAAFARFAEDLDGDDGKDWSDSSYYSHRDILDTELEYNDWAPRLYHGFVTLDGVIKNTEINLGRFYLTHQNTFQLDGVDATVKVTDMVSVYAFGGKPVSFYTDIEDDRVYGGGINVNVMERTKVAAEYARLDVQDIEDDYSKFRIDQSIPNGNIAVAYTLLNDAGTVNVDGVYEVVATGTIITAGYEGLLDEVDNDNTYVVNPMTNLLLSEEKYNKYKLSVYQAVGAHFAAGLSYEMKDVDENGNFDNRDFNKFKAIVDIFGIPSENTYLSIGAEVWNIDSTDDSDDNSRVQYTAQLSQKVGETMDVWFGSSFSRYEYDYINDRRKDSVRSYYVGGQYQPTQIVSFLVDLSMEDTDFYDDLGDNFDKNYTAEVWANFTF